MRRKIGKYTRIILISLLVLLLTLFLFYFELVIYGIHQGIGQVNILWKAQPLETFLKDPAFPDSLKKKIRLIQEIKHYAVDSLGLRDGNSYRKMYDQQGKPILWVVTACAPYALKAKEWNYGFLGNMSYKGFFILDKAKKLKKELDKEGWDTDLDEVSAWSTLGWFNDPVLSSMLYRSEGSLAALIIHEMTHATVWIKGNVEFNENLADFVGDLGAEYFLADKYGEHSQALKNYRDDKKDIELFSGYILKSALQLERLYKGFSKNLPVENKKNQKEALIRKITDGLAEVRFHRPECFKKIFAKSQPNNTFFMSFIRYRSRQNQFEKEFREKFNANFKNYLAYLKEIY